MSIFKITNITNLLGKREYKFNSELEINFINSFTKNKLLIKAGETAYLIAQSLPISAQKLRVKNLITISEISESEFAKINQPVLKTEPKPILKEPNLEESIKSLKKGRKSNI